MYFRVFYLFESVMFVSRGYRGCQVMCCSTNFIIKINTYLERLMCFILYGYDRRLTVVTTLSRNVYSPLLIKIDNVITDNDNDKRRSA